MKHIASDVERFSKLIGAALALAAAIGSIWGAGVRWQHHVERDEQQEMKILHQAEEIRVLQEVVYSELPQWTKSIFESQKEH